MTMNGSLVLLLQVLEVRENVHAVDAAVGPEVDEDDLAGEVLREREGHALSQALLFPKSGAFSASRVPRDDVQGLLLQGRASTSSTRGPRERQPRRRGRAQDHGHRCDDVSSHVEAEILPSI